MTIVPRPQTGPLEWVLAGSSLVCPRCRRAGEGGIVEAALEVRRVFKKEGEEILDGTLACANGECGAIYPVVGGVPIIVRDMTGWWRSQRAEVSAVLPKGDALREYFDVLDAEASPHDAAKALLGTYMTFHYGHGDEVPAALRPVADPRAFWATLVAAAQPEAHSEYACALDLGCSVGRYTFELARMSRLAVGIDTDFGKVFLAERMRRCGTVTYERKVRGRCFETTEASFSARRNVLFLVGDVLDPPFRAESFDLVAGLNLIDSVSLPLVLLGQMDALLSGGGLLILCAPYEWRAEICATTEWLETEDISSPVMLRRILEGAIVEQTGFAYRVLAECPEIPWALRNSSRHWSAYLVHLLKAVKASAPATGNPRWPDSPAGSRPRP